MKLIKTKLQNGLTLWYRSDDRYIGQRIALRKYEEYESELIVRQALRQASAKGGQAGFVAVDVGANIGYYTLLLAKVCKRVYAIEPDKNCFSILKKNVEENNLKNVLLINKAVSDKKGEVDFIHNQENFGDSRLQSPSATPYPPLTRGNNTIISTISLDELLNKENRINLIKIDVQGHEPQVIAGAKKIIKKYSPILFLEFNGDFKMIKFLKKYYKNIFSIDYWFYILRLGIKIDKKMGYADLLVTNKNMSFWERYSSLQWKKVIKKIIEVK